MLKNFSFVCFIVWFQNEWFYWRFRVDDSFKISNINHSLHSYILPLVMLWLKCFDSHAIRQKHSIVFHDWIQHQVVYYYYYYYCCFFWCCYGRGCRRWRFCCCFFAQTQKRNGSEIQNIYGNYVVRRYEPTTWTTNRNTWTIKSKYYFKNGTKA